MHSLTDIEWAVLRAIRHGGALELRGGSGAAEVVSTFMPDQRPISSYDFMEAMSSLLAERLVYLNFSQRDPIYWALAIAHRGYRLMDAESVSPDDPRGYMDRLLKTFPDTSEEIRFYLTEALKAYEGDAYAASTVMIGVAAEQCFYEVAEAFVEFLEGDAKEKFRGILNNPRGFYVYKMEEFQKRLYAAKGHLTAELADSLETQVIAAMHLIRANRNDAGHPTKIFVDEFTAYTNIAIYWRIHQRLYGLRDYFEKNRKG